MAAMLAMMGLQAVMGLSAGYSAQQAANRQTVINKANAEAANLVRGARNELTVVKGRQARANQAENNNRTLYQGGRAVEAAAINYRRMRDSAITDDFESQIRLAEQAGASVASQAMAGAGGSVVDMVNGTTALRNSRIQQAQGERMKAGDYDAAQNAKDIQRATIQSLDRSSIIDELDYNVDLAQEVHRSGNLFTDVMGGQDPKNVANVLAGTSNFSFSNPFADRAGSLGSGSDGRSRTITGGR